MFNQVTLRIANSAHARGLALKLRAELQQTEVEKEQLRHEVETLQQALEEEKRQRSDAENSQMVAGEAASERRRVRVEAVRLPLAEEAHEVAAQEATARSTRNTTRPRRPRVEDVRVRRLLAEVKATNPGARGTEDTAADSESAQDFHQASLRDAALVPRPLGDAPPGLARGVLAEMIRNGSEPTLALKGWTVIRGAIPASEVSDAKKQLNCMASRIKTADHKFFHGISKNPQLSHSAAAWRCRKLLIDHFGAVLSVPRTDYNRLLVSNDAVAFGDESSHRREAGNVRKGGVPGIPDWLHVDMSVEQLQNGGVADDMQGYLSLQGSVGNLVLEAFYVEDSSSLFMLNCHLCF